MWYDDGAYTLLCSSSTTGAENACRIELSMSMRLLSQSPRIIISSVYALNPKNQGNRIVCADTTHFYEMNWLELQYNHL